MKRKIKKKREKKGKKEIGKIEEERKNTLLFVLILLVIIISIFSTLIVLNSIDNAKKFFISQKTSTGSAQVELNILPNPEDPLATAIPAVTSQVVLHISSPK